MATVFDQGWERSVEHRATAGRGVAAAQSHRWRGVSGLILSLGGPLLLLGLWQLATERALVSPEILPQPAFVWQTFGDMVASGELARNVAISLSRLVRGFAVGAVIGSAIGLAMGASRRIEALIYPSFRAFALVPLMAWLPLLMLLFGIGETLKTVAIAKAAAIPMAMTAFAAVRAIPRGYHEVGEALLLTPRTKLTRLILPAIALPMFTGLRQALGNAWVALVGVELLASTEGIGYLMNWGRVIFQLDVVIVGIVVIGVIGFVLDASLRRIERVLARRSGGAA